MSTTSNSTAKVAPSDDDCGECKSHDNDVVKNNSTTATIPTTTTTTNVDASEEEEIPILCQFWRWIYRNQPFPAPIYLSFFGATKNKIDITMTISTILAFTLLRSIMAPYILVKVFGWPNTINNNSNMNATVTTNIGATGVTALFHSVPMVPSLLLCFLYGNKKPKNNNSAQNNNNNNNNNNSDAAVSMHHHNNKDDNKTKNNIPRTTTETLLQRCWRNYNPYSYLNESPLWWQETVMALLQVNTGFMIYDILYNVLWYNYQFNDYTAKSQKSFFSHSDYEHMAHHAILIVFAVSTRILRCGHEATMMLLLLGEITNPCHNGYKIAFQAQSLHCCNGRLSQFAFDVVHIAFAFSFCFVRGIIAPIVISHFVYVTYTIGRHRVPLAYLLLWYGLIVLIYVGGINAMIKQWGITQRHYSLMLSKLPLLYSRISSSSDEL